MIPPPAPCTGTPAAYECPTAALLRRATCQCLGSAAAEKKSTVPTAYNGQWAGPSCALTRSRAGNDPGLCRAAGARAKAREQARGWERQAHTCRPEDPLLCRRRTDSEPEAPALQPGHPVRLRGAAACRSGVIIRRLVRAVTVRQLLKSPPRVVRRPRLFWPGHVRVRAAAAQKRDLTEAPWKAPRCGARRRAAQAARRWRAASGAVPAASGASGPHNAGLQTIPV